MTNETQPAPATGELDTFGERGQRALEAAAAGLYVFPLHPGTKNMPAVKDWENEATRDPEKIMQWWASGPTTWPSRPAPHGSWSSTSTR
ncbi:Bifunctional DNA primase/polymerase, N-terminal [Pseudonocardia ammonioxydans]|uniref:Bifunctional DNA primase/polymerase, N-terminal n=1 Tax=Pseudonocardia ammonioxydans TaxID=260086 RepID=A0A1I5GIN3_PSUAM|nr:Bifunctional DNA primase/polymerase, N-terminal [Pseudonocardia ammonioxydans]